MINALHLVWIIPVAVSCGFFMFALMAANEDND